MHGQVYGYDSTSGTFMVSKDNTSWDRRSQLSLRDFAVDPAQPDRIVATAERGPVRSGDGGRTWSPLESAPQLVVVSWDRAAGLFGVDLRGAVHRSDDGGSTWTATGSVGGEPEALTVETTDGAAAVYVAVADTGILASRDGGGTFAVRYTEQTS